MADTPSSSPAEHRPDNADATGRDRLAIRAVLAAAITAMVVTAAVSSFAIYRMSKPLDAEGKDPYAALATMLATPRGLSEAQSEPKSEAQWRMPLAPVPQYQAPRPQPTLPTSPAPTAQVQPSAQPATTQPAVSRIAALLSDPKVAGQIMDNLEKAPAIQVAGKINQARPVFAFFDPRCPYCHTAYQALTGQVTVRWLPTLALGKPENGDPILAALLGPTEATKDGNSIVSVALLQDPDRLKRFDAIMRGEKIPSAEINESQQFVASENLQLLVELYRYHNQPLGVPTFIVPTPDGGAKFIRGWDKANTLNEIEAAYQGKAKTP